jgi:tRNA(Ile)-lysidine synthase
MPLPWTDLHHRLHRVLKSRSLLPPGHRLLLGVSGGQDSLCLWRLCLDLQPQWGWELGILHCDHRWRSDSQANAHHVQTLAAQWGTPYHGIVADRPLPTEAAARQWRYQGLAHCAQTHHYQAVLTAHTASDRAETLLQNLIRGSGADGLGALPWQRDLAPGLPLVRPLLFATRQETGDFCAAQGLPLWVDSTNDDPRYGRNRLRLEVLPLLRQHFNPQVDRHLAHTADLMAADVAYLEAQAHHLRQQIQDDRRLDRTLLQPAPLALQRRVIRQFLGQWLPCAPTFAHIEKTIALISAPQGSQTDPFPGGAIVQVRKPWLVLTDPHLP